MKIIQIGIVSAFFSMGLQAGEPTMSFGSDGSVSLISTQKIDFSPELNKQIKASGFKSSNEFLRQFLNASMRFHWSYELLGQLVQSIPHSNAVKAKEISETEGFVRSIFRDDLEFSLTTDSLEKLRDKVTSSIEQTDRASAHLAEIAERSVPCLRPTLNYDRFFIKAKKKKDRDVWVHVKVEDGESISPSSIQGAIQNDFSGSICSGRAKNSKQNFRQTYVFVSEQLKDISPFFLNLKRLIKKINRKGNWHSILGSYSDATTLLKAFFDSQSFLDNSESKIVLEARQVDWDPSIYFQTKLNRRAQSALKERRAMLQDALTKIDGFSKSLSERFKVGEAFGNIFGRWIQSQIASFNLEGASEVIAIRRHLDAERPILAQEVLSEISSAAIDLIGEAQLEVLGIEALYLDSLTRVEKLQMEISLMRELVEEPKNTIGGGSVNVAEYSDQDLLAIEREHFELEEKVFNTWRAQ